jgi:tetraacyldisaccharide 4'-kinase
MRTAGLRLNMRAAWLEARDEPLWRKAAFAPLVPLSWLYAGGAWLHRGLYRAGVRRRSRLPVRVVSVGNLVVGGAGKTPLTAFIATGLRRRGHRVAIASRGAGRRLPDAVTVVSDGRHVLGRQEIAGDEAMVLAAHAVGVPVLVGRDRALVGWRALSVFGADVLVLDDGFQHHRLHRDVEVVAFDGGLGFGNAAVLPRGPLREPASALAAAHVVGVVDGPLPAEDAQRIDRLAGSATRFEARRVPRDLRPLRGGSPFSPAALAGQDVGVIAAIANPRGFRRTLEALGANVVAERLFRDHHRYRHRDLRGLAKTASLWVTTEKDAVKLLPFWAGGADLRVLRIEVEVSEPERLLSAIDARLR